MLNDKKIKVIEMIATGDYTISEVMEQVGMHRTTYYDWARDKEFMAELDKRLQAMKTKASKDFTSRLPDAIEEYWKLCQPNVEPRTREKALSTWIERSLGRISSTININDERTDETEVDILAAMDSVDGENEE